MEKQKAENSSQSELALVVDNGCFPIVISLDTFVHTLCSTIINCHYHRHYTSVLSRGLCKLMFYNDNYMLLTAAVINEVEGH